MPFSAGTVTAGAEPAAVSAVPESGITVRNDGRARVYLGGPDVSAEGAAAGYPLGPGETASLPGVKPRETPVVPAPEGDLDPAVLYACCAGDASGRIAFITVT